MRPMILATYPMFIGFGYLVSQELSASIVLFTFAGKLLAVLGRVLGHEPPGFPYFQEQSAGGYVAIALFMLWVARGHLRDVWRKCLGDERVNDADEALPYRLAAMGLMAALYMSLVFL